MKKVNVVFKTQEGLTEVNTESSTIEQAMLFAAKSNNLSISQIVQVNTYK